ncbi:WD40/YVTN/BNR-like repeat-containing protein [Natrinema sp. 74]|uniref:WD40/YVTN/BNR-like repeat-containing protein n=1 Tax=Natrinema sp. 74 TaxID=3384159 RepID=UPI0038D3B32E
MTTDSRSDEGFVPFFRRYTKTWVHAVATAGLTAFGTLTIVHRWFVVLALASYVVPPIVLYLREPAADQDEGTRATAQPTESPSTDETTDAARETTDASAARGARSEPESLEWAETGADAKAGDATDTRPTGGPDTAFSGATADSTGDRRDADPQNDGESSTDRMTDDERPRHWEVVDISVGATLRDVCVTEAGSVYATGDGGLVLAAAPADDGTDWTVALEDGPAAAGADLRGVDATADGDAVWIAGDGGALARLEAESGRHTDYTAPAGITDNWLGIAVCGASGDETVLLINGSGAVCRGRYRDGEPSWEDPVKPGGGSSLSAIALADASIGYCCDTNDGVFETTDGGRSFEEIGPVGADGTLEAVATLGRQDCLVSADDGVVHRYGGGTWTPERVADGALPGLARREGETLACSADGEIYERTDAAEWTQADADASASLLAVSIRSAGDRAVAVGNEGTVLERR